MTRIREEEEVIFYKILWGRNSQACILMPNLTITSEAMQYRQAP